MGRQLSRSKTDKGLAMRFPPPLPALNQHLAEVAVVLLAGGFKTTCGEIRIRCGELKAVIFA
jgi:hypothetical protein